jgi:hypothetical protein
MYNNYLNIEMGISGLAPVKFEFSCRRNASYDFDVTDVLL